MCLRPFIKYPGGKNKELLLINENKPSSIERYFEHFVGGGSFFFFLILELIIPLKLVDHYLY